MIDLVCSVCGSKNWRDPIPSVDKRWPLVVCLDHQQKSGRSPLISARAFAKRQRIPAAPPEDMFGSLTPEEQAALRKPVRLR